MKGRNRGLATGHKVSFGAGVASASVMDENDFKFMKFVVDFSKEYKSIEEFNMRKENYLFMEAEIARINAEQDTHVAGHNFLSDFTREEYTAMLGLKNMAAPQRNGAKHVETDLGIPTSHNWCPANGNY